MGGDQGTCPHQCQMTTEIFATNIQVETKKRLMRYTKGYIPTSVPPRKTHHEVIFSLRKIYYFPDNDLYIIPYMSFVKAQLCLGEQKSKN